jgi:arabinosaccharide transport system permease protein
MIVKTSTEKLFQVLKYLLLAAVVFLMLFPIYSLILASFRPGRDLMRYGISFTTLIPNVWDGKNFLNLFVDRNGRYLIWFGNSILLSALQTVFSLAFSSFVGYGLGVYQFKGRNALLMLVLFVMMVPLQILILPLYTLMIGLGTMNTYWGVLLPFVVSPFAIFFFRQYAVTIPKDYLDAGRIDGLGEYSIFSKIITPLMAPAFGAMAILMAQQSWNSFLWPLIVMRTPEMYTLPIGLNSLLTPYGNNYETLIAGSCMATIPLIILFVIFQRYFISGLSTGGIKG